MKFQVIAKRGFVRGENILIICHLEAKERKRMSFGLNIYVFLIKSQRRRFPLSTFSPSSSWFYQRKATGV